jgi:hypothetical protein
VLWGLHSPRGHGDNLLGRGSGFGFDQRDVVLRIMCAERRKNALGNGLPLVSVSRVGMFGPVYLGRDPALSEVRLQTECELAPRASTSIA